MLFSQIFFLKVLCNLCTFVNFFVLFLTISKNSHDNSLSDLWIFLLFSVFYSFISFCFFGSFFVYNTFFKFLVLFVSFWHLVFNAFQNNIRIPCEYVKMKCFMKKLSKIVATLQNFHKIVHLYLLFFLRPWMGCKFYHCLQSQKSTQIYFFCPFYPQRVWVSKKH